MRCDKHRKDHIGGCIWCGRRLCAVCVVRKERSKLYCEKCSVIISSITRERMPRLAPNTGKRFELRDNCLIER